MKDTMLPKRYVWINPMLLVLVFGLTSHQLAEAQQFSLEHSVFGNGGDEVQNDTYRIVGTVGQPMIGVFGTSSNIISSGFWYVTPGEDLGFPTPSGTNVEVQPVDATTRQSPVALTFSEVTQEGKTYLTTSGTGPPLPTAFKLGNPPTYYDLTSTANYDSVTVCIDYSEMNFNNKLDVKLYHFENGSWKDITNPALSDLTNDIICGNAGSLSPFVLVEPVVPEDVTAMIELNQSNTRFDRRKGQISVMATLTNTSSEALSQPLSMIINRITPDTVTVANADGITADGKPYYDYSNSVSDGKLEPDETSEAKILAFNNPSRAQFELEVLFRAVKVGNSGVLAAPAIRPYAAQGQRIRISIPVVSALAQNFPNPFNPETWIPYELAQATHVKITIYDIQGQLVRTLDLGHRPVGRYVTRDKAAYWDGRNHFGERVGSGVYFYQIQAADFQSTRKMVILK